MEDLIKTFPKPQRWDCEEFRNFFVRKKVCYFCGRKHIETIWHHVSLPGMTGQGTKAPDWSGLPLCVTPQFSWEYEEDPAEINPCHVRAHSSGKDRIERQNFYSLIYECLWEWATYNFMREDLIKHIGAWIEEEKWIR